MENALAIIQPSLFEGWSTVIEDAKAMNQNCIVSDIEVHKEQLNTKAYYFNPHNEDMLIEKMIEVKSIHKKSFDFNYEKNINENAIHFVKIIRTIISND